MRDGNGISVDIKELITLKRYAQLVHYPPESKITRSGPHVSKIRGRGMNFSEVRNYQAGDEIRHMEWRVTARTGRPHVKIYQEERERPVVILTDFNPSMAFGTKVAFKSVVAARLAALIAWTVVKQGDRIGGLLFSATQHSEFNPRSRDSGVLPLLACLSHYTQQIQIPSKQEEQPRKLKDALIRLRRVVKPGSIVVLISDFYSMESDCEPHLNRLREHNDILAYHVCDRIELAPPPPQQYAITNGHQELIFDTSDKVVHTAFEKYCQQRIELLKGACKRLHTPYIQVTAEHDLPLVRQTFPRRTRG